MSGWAFEVAVERVRAAYRAIGVADRPEVWTSLRDEASVVAEVGSLCAGGVGEAGGGVAGGGVPLLVGVKDNIDVAGVVTTAGARSFGYLPTRDATAVARLRRWGAVVVGKTNLDQFATGLVGTRSPFGAVRNAWDPRRVAGGSSSGSAVAVALGLVDLALGTDTAGSGRVPAALNGVWGVKPTRGLVPVTGVVPAARSLDCVSVLARDLDTAVRAVGVMGGPDGWDAMAGRERRAPAVPTGRVGIPRGQDLVGLAPGWVEAFDVVVGRLGDGGVGCVEVSLDPFVEVARLLYEGAFVAERFAAVGGFILEHADLVGDDLDPTVAGIILGGRDRTAVELFADLHRLGELAALACQELDGLDALVTPTTTSHPTLAEVEADPVGVNSRLGRFTNFVNLLDMCAIAVPAGTVDGLPFGVMVSGRAFEDATVQEVGRVIAGGPVDLFVVGAHLSGQPLNAELVSRGARLVGPARTVARYRLFDLGGTVRRPGLVRAEDGRAGVVEGEVWRLSRAAFGDIVARVPRPLCIGKVELGDGRLVNGFLCEQVEALQGEEITTHGSWLRWLDTQPTGPTPPG